MNSPTLSFHNLFLRQAPSPLNNNPSPSQAPKGEGKSLPRTPVPYLIRDDTGVWVVVYKTGHTGNNVGLVHR
jgi:hypothetical protein